MAQTNEEPESKSVARLRKLDSLGGGYTPATPDETVEEIAELRRERDRRIAAALGDIAPEMEEERPAQDREPPSTF